MSNQPSIIGPDKFKVENLPPQLYNSIEREHFTLDFNEAFMLAAYINSLEKDSALSRAEKISLRLSIDKTLASIEMKFNAILTKHNFNRRGCFVKFSNVSPKDRGLKPIYSFKEFLKAIRDSERVRTELFTAITGKFQGVSPLALPEVTEKDYNPVSIILCEWIDAKRYIEFRTFVFDEEIYFASQYLWWYYYEQIADNPTRLINTLKEELATMQAANGIITPDLVVDFWVSGDLKQAKFLEFNPYQESHPVLFGREINRAGFPIEYYKSLAGLLRFTGKSDNGFDNMPLEFALPEFIRDFSPSEAEAFSKKYSRDAAAQEVYKEYQVVKMLKPHSLVISQKSF